MKRKAIAAVLGAAGVIGLAASSYGQGNVYFNTYASTPYWPIVYGSTAQGIDASLAGTAAGQNVSAELGFMFGTQTSFTLIDTSVTPVSPLTEPPNGTGSPTTGYINGSTVSIPGYSAGPIQFEILAWVASGLGSGPTGTYADALYKGALTWTEPSIPSGTSPASYFTALPGELTLQAVPEPATMALGGLGLASLLVFRRKKA